MNQTMLTLFAYKVKIFFNVWLIWKISEVNSGGQRRNSVTFGNLLWQQISVVDDNLWG
jgi:hypothetical protein